MTNNQIAVYTIFRHFLWHNVKVMEFRIFCQINSINFYLTLLQKTSFKYILMNFLRKWFYPFIHFSIHPLQKNMIQSQITIFAKNLLILFSLNLSLVDILGAHTQVKYSKLQTQVCCGHLSEVGQLNAVLYYHTSNWVSLRQFRCSYVWNLVIIFLLVLFFSIIYIDSSG